MAQTPKKRKQYSRVYRKDLEQVVNNVFNYNVTNNNNFKTIPQTIEEAQTLPEWPKWRKAIEKEIGAIYRTGSFIKVNNVPTGAKAIQCRWVFKIKPANEQEPEIYKARLVAKGYKQKFGVDYQETFAAVAKMTSLRILIALAARNQERLTKLDVSNAFLESNIDRDVYIHPPEGFPQGGFFKLKKALYGLKQSPRLFAQTFAKELKSLGFRPTISDQCIYQHPQSDIKILVVVDDCIIAGNDEGMRRKVERHLSERFNIKIFDKVETFINIQIEETKTHYKMHQESYIEKLLERFGLQNCKVAATPAVPNPQGDNTPLPNNHNYRQIVGSLIYLMATRPDVCSIIIELSKYLENPTQLHLQMAKRVLRYLAGTKNQGINFKKGRQEVKIVCFSDSDWAGCKETRKSVSGYVV